MSDGVLYVEILPSTKGIGKAVEGDLNKQFKNAEKTGEGFFSRVGTWAKRGALAVGGMVAAVGALAVGGGISRALNIEDATAKLKGLGHDTQSVELIMSNALASVKGTAFGLDAAATTAATAIAAGIKPGKELERYLRLTADAATIAGVSLDDMGSILNKTTAKGKVQLEELNQLQERNIPIIQWLADEYGVTAEAMYDMVSRGEVDVARFRKALEDNLGGAALSAGDTTRGAFANMMTSISRFGEVLVGDGLGAAKTFFNEVTTILDGVGERIGPLVEWVQEKLGGLFQIDGMGERFLAFLDSFNLGEIVPQLMAGRGDVVAFAIRLVDDMIQGLVGAIPGLVTSVADMISTVIGALTAHGPSLVAGAMTLFLGLATGLLEVLPQLVQTASSLIISFVGMLATMLPALVSGATELFLGLVTAISTVVPHLVRTLSNVMPQIVTAVVEAVPLIVTAIVSALPMLIQGAVQLFMGLVQAISTVLPILITALVTAIPQIISAITTAIPLVIEALISALPMIIEGALQLFLGIVLGVAAAIPEIITAVVGLIPVLITALIGMIPALIEGAVQLFTGLLQALPIILPALITGIFESILAIVSALVESIPLILDAAITLFTSLIEALPVILPDLIMAIVGMIPLIVQTLIGLASTLLSAAVQLFMALVTGLGTVIPKVFSKLGELWPGIWGSIKEIPGRMLDFGKNIIQGLIDGVGSMVSNAVNSVKNVGGQMLDGVKSFLGIKSPSRRFRDEVGKMVGLGLLAGVEDQSIRGRIEAAVDHLIDVPSGLVGANASAGFNQTVTVARDIDPVIFGRKTGRAIADTLTGAGVV